MPTVRAAAPGQSFTGWGHGSAALGKRLTSRAAAFGQRLAGRGHRAATLRKLPVTLREWLAAPWQRLAHRQRLRLRAQVSHAVVS
jgi:hypothetical protein